MSQENKTPGNVKAVLMRLCLLVGMAGWLPLVNAEVLASLGDVQLDADAVMRLLEESDDSATELTEEQQRNVIFQNLLRKYLARQAEEAGFAEQPEVAAQIRVLAEEAQLYNAYLRSLVPVATLTTSQVVAIYRANLEQFQRPESVSVNQLVLTRANYGNSFDSVVALTGEAMQASSLDFAEFDSDLGLSAEDQSSAALERTIAVADLLPSVREALAAAVGNVVGPISLPQGVAFIQLNERLPAGPRPFDEVEQFVRDQSSTALRGSRETAYIDRLIESNPIEIKGERSWAGWLEGKRLPRRPEKRVIAEMGDVEYSLAELLAFIEVLKTTGYNQQLLSDPEYLREEFVKARLVRKYLVSQAKANNFDDQPRVKAMVAQARRVILSDAWLAQLVDGALSTPEQTVIDDYYQENIANYTVPAAVNLSQLLIEAGEGMAAKVGDFARSIEADESNFKTRAQELSLETSGVTSTFTEGWMSLTDIPVNIFQQIQGLASGGVSAPISVPEGTVFIGVNQVQRARVIPLEQIRERVEAEYVLQQRVAERNRRVAELRDAVKFADLRA